VQAKAEQFAATFSAALDALLAQPHKDPPGFPGVQPVNAISLCKLRWETAAAYTNPEPWNAA